MEWEKLWHNLKHKQIPLVVVITTWLLWAKWLLNSFHEVPRSEDCKTSHTAHEPSDIHRPFSLECTINPFTAMLVASWLRKLSIKMPNLKSLRTFFPFIWASERTAIKMHSTKSRVVIGPSNILFAGVYVSIFSLEFVQAGAVKGLMTFPKSNASCHWQPIQQGY